MILKVSKAKSEAKQPASQTIFKNFGDQSSILDYNFIYFSVEMKW